MRYQRCCQLAESASGFERIEGCVLGEQQVAEADRVHVVDSCLG